MPSVGIIIRHGVVLGDGVEVLPFLDVFRAQCRARLDFPSGLDEASLSLLLLIMMLHRVAIGPDRSWKGVDIRKVGHAPLPIRLLILGHHESDLLESTGRGRTSGHPMNGSFVVIGRVGSAVGGRE